MKTTTASVFLLFIFSTTQSSFLFGVATTGHNPVLDIEGEVVRTGIEYYAVSAIWGPSGGGLAIGNSSKNDCPGIVVQSQSDVDYGAPVIFSNANTSDDAVRLSSYVNIEFPSPVNKFCLTSTVWMLDDFETSAGTHRVGLGGIKGNPGCETMRNWFQLEKFDMNHVYKFKYCQKVCDTYMDVCHEIQKAEDPDGRMRLVFSADGSSGQGYPFIFIKVGSATTKKSSCVE
ncbi:hypothetical protein V6N12_002237 [Hibiscus sabdariffa]|uniref:Uncharacterized protein n=1 Tax=Hibiscus sabdariffa TaxID=183260 RepID=A0ABR1ZM12_9ROSI